MIMKYSAYISAFLFVVTIAWFGWTVYRQWNYYFIYEQMVQETVCEMVKPEHLKENTICKAK
jgi:hypothetical protein